MSYRLFPVFLSSLTIGMVVSSSFSASAEDTERYIKMGQDSAGEPVFLDTLKLHGTSFVLSRKLKYDRTSEAKYFVSCSDKRLFFLREFIYGSNGFQFSDSGQKNKEVFAHHASPLGLAMDYVCKKIGADG